jgi:hypothetical protein
MVGKAVYVIVFNTTDDSILGPIRLYMDRDSYNIIGMDPRF